MARRAIVSILLLAWLGALGAAAFHMQNWHIEKEVLYAQPYRDSLALPTPERAKVMALGYDNMIASLLWLRVIQVFGAKLHHIRENKLELDAIENAFNVITELDPRFIDAYKFGNFVLGDEGDDQERALKLLDRGIDRNGNRTFSLAYEAAFICIMDLKDYDRARAYTNKALQAPDCPPYVARLIQYIETKKGNYEIALERWVRQYFEASAQHERYFVDTARMQMAHTVNLWHTDIIEKAMDLYFERHKDYPARLDQLVEEGLIEKGRRVNPLRLKQLIEDAAPGAPIEQIVAFIMGPIEKGGVIEEKNTLPLDPDNEPYLRIDDTRIPMEKKPTVTERNKIRRMTDDQLAAIRRRVEQFHAANDRYPSPLTELPQMQPGSQENLKAEDPAGMPWNYNPATGKLASYVLPEL
jgi:tetratricopeptide (TPR) repeat protein